MHLCLTMECMTSGLHLSVFLMRSQHPPPDPYPHPPPLARTLSSIPVRAPGMGREDTGEGGGARATPAQPA